ncbi:DUF401 family protein [Chloroflexota bacterium]
MMLSPSLALLISILGILILLRMKVHVCFAVFAGGLILTLLVLEWNTIPSLMWNSLKDYQTVRLLVIIASAMTLSRLMEVKGMLSGLAVTMESINPKLALHFIPAIIGLVPMPGGALVSATAVKDLAGRMGLTAERSAFINYWFRHLWEFSIPVYPAIIITSVLLSVPISFVVIRLLPMTVLTILSGTVISYAMLKNVQKVPGKPPGNLTLEFLKASWPILLLVSLILLRLEAMIAFPLTLVLLILQQRTKWPELGKVVKYGLDPRILFLVYAVMLYKSTIEISGAAYTIFTDMQSIGLPPVIILIALPALMGFAAGLSIAFAGVALPLLVPYFSSVSGINSAAVLLAYVSGMTGYLLSPVHLCLILSTEYLQASLAKVYKYISLPVLFIETVAIIIYLLSI